MANIIANGTLGGIALAPTAGVDNAIVSNVIVDHGGSAIDLGADGVTQNDAGDIDSGPNDLLNRPILDRAEETAGTVSIDIRLDAPAGAYRVELFDGSNEGPFGEGGGDALLHAFDIAHTGGGVETFGTSFAGAAGDVITATVTEGTTNATFGSTSEFSYATAVVTPTALVVNSTDDDLDAVNGDGTCDTGQLNALGLPECTLRAAISEANSGATATAIHFEIPDIDAGYAPADGYWSIAPTTVPLPLLTVAGLALDATTQPTWAHGPVIQLDGSNPALDPSADGIGVLADAVAIRGLSITNWPDDGAHTPAAGVVFDRNWFGVDPTGTPAHNLSSDVIVYGAASNVLVGGSSPNAANVFAAGGDEDGVLVENTASGTVIRNNSFGLGADGTTVLGSAAEAVVVLNDSMDTTIDQNVFAHLPNAAIVQQDNSTVVITGNTFGRDGNGDPAPVDLALWTNGTGDIRFGGTAAGDGNTVANSVAQGIATPGYTGTLTILGNSFVGNGGLAVDLLQDGVSPIDSPDVDGVLNRPVISEGRAAAGTVTAAIELDVAAGDYRIEFFANPSGADPTGFGEGETFVHGETITHGGTGAETFLIAFAGATGDVITATATQDLGGGTYGASSEFSNAATVVVETVATVNSTGDAADANPGDGACTTATPGECTLRAAIEEANASTDVTAILFDIPTSDAGHVAGVWTIATAGPLPAVTGATLIDATTQSGYTSTPVVEIDASGQGASVGLPLSADDLTLRALAIGGAPSHGVVVTGDRVTIEQSHVGVDAAGTAAAGNGARGVEVLGDDIVLRANVVSANTADGIVFVGVTGGLVVDSLVGTDVTGNAARGNGEEGIQIESSQDVVIGQPGAGNVISGNGHGGINGWIGSPTGIAVQANLIGVGLDGTTEVANGTARAEGGITVRTSGSDWLIGGRGVGEGNLIANNFGDGIQLVNVNGAADDVAVLGNRIVDNTGLAIDHGDDGVTANDAGDVDAGINGLLNAPEITGGSEIVPGIIAVPFDLDAPANADGYRIEFFANPGGIDPSGHGEGEVVLGSIDVAGAGSGVFQYAGSLGDAVSATATEIVGAGFGATSEFSLTFFVTGDNVLIVNSTGDAADAHPGNGVCDTGGDNTATEDECTLRAAIDEANATADIDTIEFAMPATEPGHGGGVWTIAPATRLPNVVDTVAIDGSTQPGWTATPVVEIDGAAVPAGIGIDLEPGSDNSTIRSLAIGNFTEHAIEVESNGNLIVGNHIGLDAAGTTAMPLGSAAIDVEGDGNTIGGVGTTERNIVAAAANGVLIDRGAGNSVIGNYVGTDVTGTIAIGMTFDGIRVQNDATSTIVGGPTVAHGNIVGGVSADGIQLEDDTSDGTVVRNNLVGVGADGTTSVPVGGNGIVVVLGSDTITIADNVVGNTNDDGIEIDGTSRDVTIRSNLLGADRTGGAHPLGGAGIKIEGGAQRVLIGGVGVGDGNLVSNSGGGEPGIDVNDAATNDVAIVGNSIVGNAGIGIDLGVAGSTPNDVADGDAGPNDQLNTPELLAASAGGGTVAIDYALDVPAGAYRIELFANPAGADPSGFGEGEVLVGVASIVHPGGSVSYSLTTPGVAGDVFSATTSEDLGAGSFGATSEFSAVRTATADALVVTDRSIQRSDATAAGGLGGSVDGTGAIGPALDFAGDTGRLVGPPTEINRDELTLSGWIYPTSLASDATLISKKPVGGGAVYELLVDGSTGEAVARVHAGVAIEARGGSVGTGAWSQVAATWDGAVLRVYVDGVEVGSTAASGTLGTDVGAPLIVGNDSTLNAGVGGGLDQVEISRVARSADWIATGYNNLSNATSMVSIGGVETGVPGSWTTSTATTRSGSHALAAPETAAGADAWAVATGIDEPGLVFESWWFLTDPSTTAAAAGTNTGAAPTDQREVAAGPAGLALGAIDGAVRTTDATDPASISLGTWTRVEIRTDELGSSSVWLDGVEVIPPTAHSGGRTGGSAGLRSGELAATERWYVDDVRIRRYVSDEPETTLGPLDRR